MAAVPAAPRPRPDETMLDAALRYLARGWPVFPLRDRPYTEAELRQRRERGQAVDADGWRKHPAVPWVPFSQRLPTEAEARAWWGAEPSQPGDGRPPASRESGIGMACGHLSGIVVVDCDPRNGGDPLLLPASGLRARSGGGGEHAFFRLDRERPLKSGKHPTAAGIDVLAKGRMVVLPPSLHPSGGRYEWISDGRAGDQPELGERPPREPREPRRGPGGETPAGEPDRWLARMFSEPCPDGRRHDDAGKVAGWLASRGIPEDVGVEIVATWDRAWGSMGPEDARSTARGVYRTAGASWAAAEWDQVAPPFPVDLLPDCLREAAIAVAENVQTAIDLPAVLGLGAASAALSGRALAAILDPDGGEGAEDSWTEEAGLFVAAIADPSTLKSPVLKAMVERPLDLERARRMATWVDVRTVAKARRRRAENALKDVETRIRRLDADPAADPEAVMALHEEQERLVEELDEPPPVKPITRTANVTPEKLEDLLTTLPTLTLITDEGRVIFNAAGGLYSQTEQLAPFLAMFSGGYLASDRMGRETVHGRARGAAILTTQPSVLRSAGSNKAFHGEGFFARWLWSYPSEFPPILEHARPMRTGPGERWTAQLERIFALPLAARRAHGELDDPPIARLSPDASRLIVRLRVELAVLARDGGRMAGHGSWLAKLHGVAARLALSLHALGVGGGRPGDREVSREAVERAIELCRLYFIPHALRAYESMGQGGEGDARAVWAAFRGRDRVTLRDLSRAFRAWSDERARAAVDALERRGFARVVAGGQFLEGKRVRADGVAILLNPIAR